MSVSLHFLAILGLCALFVQSSVAFNAQQTWVVINDTCNQGPPYGNCGSFGGWSSIGSSSNYPSGVNGGLSVQGVSGNYKPFWGIGCALTESSAYLLQQLQWNNPSAFQSLAQAAAKFTSFRIPVGTSDFALSEWTFVSNSTDWSMSSFDLNNDRYQHQMLNTLLSYRNSQPLTLIFSVWTPPIWLKNGSDWPYANLAQSNSQYYQGVANYWVAFLKSLPQYVNSEYHGMVQKIYVAVQNEPFQSPGNNLPGCSLSVDDQIGIIQSLAPNLSSLNLGGLPTPEILVLDHNWDLESDANDILNGVGSDAVGVGFHAYGGSFSDQQTMHDDQPNAEIHMTEFSGDYTDDPQGTWNWDMGNIIFGSLGLYGQSVTYWNMALDDNAGPLNPQTPGYCTSCNGVFRISSGNNVYYTQPRYFTLGFAAQCIPYGAQRVDVDVSGINVSVLAYQGSANSSGQHPYCLIIQNNDSAQNLYVELNGQYISIYLDSGAVNSVSFTA